MRPALTLLLAATLVGCSSGEKNPAAGIPTLTKLWSVPKPETLGYVTQIGDLLLGTSNITAINVDTHQLAFSISEKIHTLRTSFAPFGDNIIALTGDRSDTLTVFSKSGQVINTITIPGQTSISFGDMGPTFAGAAMYVVSGTTISKYAAADLMNPQAQPLWQRTFDGYDLAAMTVQDENRVYVSTHAEGANQIFALDGLGKTRWMKDTAPSYRVTAFASAMTVYQDKLIAVSGPAGLQAYNLETGEPAWATFPNIDICPNYNSGTADYLTIAGGKVFMGPFGGVCVLAFSADTGQPVWVFSSPNTASFATKPLYVNGIVYATNSKLWAIDADTGKALAVSADDLGSNDASPLVYDAARNQVIEWGSTGLYAYRPLR